ncbi:MAG: nuclear transport factor 2 family protein [Solirubrobacteraceae bacterium]
MSENLDLVRSIFADWERGDFSNAGWADSAIEYVHADGPDPGAWTGLAEMANAFRSWLSAWQDYTVELGECRELDDERVIVLYGRSGRGKNSGMQLGQMYARGAILFQLNDGRVTRLIHYLDRDRALADLGLGK